MTLGDRLGFRSFELIVRPDLGADIDGYRLRLRQTLGERLAELGETDVGAIVDLGKVPAPKVRRVSISHCPKLGGWAMCEAERAIGFDMELSERARPQTVGRISTPDEMSSAPHLAALWTAKESAFKRQRFDLQPATFAAVKILFARPGPDGYVPFRALTGDQEFQGLSWSPADGIWASIC